MLDVVLVPVALITVLCVGVLKRAVGWAVLTCLAAGAQQMARTAVTQVIVQNPLNTQILNCNNRDNGTRCGRCGVNQPHRRL